jgi:hypothetical protein
MTIDKSEMIWKEPAMDSCLNDMRKTMKTSVRIASVPAKISTEDTLNTSIKRHCSTSLFGFISMIMAKFGGKENPQKGANQAQVFHTNNRYTKITHFIRHLHSQKSSHNLK